MKNNIQSLLLIVLIALCGYLTIRVESVSNNKSAYFQSLKVFEGFKLQQELSSQFENDVADQKMKLDSLELQLRILYNEADKSENPEEKLLMTINFLQEKYIKTKSDFQEKNTVQADQYNQQVWKQINQYIEEYGRLNSYTYIFGAQGDGGIMYADTVNDITDEIIIYINNKYQGH